MYEQTFYARNAGRDRGARSRVGALCYYLGCIYPVRTFGTNKDGVAGMGTEAEGGTASINNEIYMAKMEQEMLYLDWCVKLGEFAA